MILDRYGIVADARTFFGKGLECAKGTVRIAGAKRQPAGSGWLLTPQIVVTPSYVLEFRSETDSRAIIVQGLDWEETVSESPEIFRAIGADADRLQFAAALIRLKQPRTGALAVSLDAVTEGQAVSVLQYPRGRDLSVSFGSVVGTSGLFVDYDADTEPGSSGAPVFDVQWRVIAMHSMGVREKKANRGLGSNSLYQMLQQSRVWKEIAEFQGFADVTAARAALATSAQRSHSGTTEQVLLRAAVRARFSPEEFADIERDVLRDKVADPAAREWVLKPGAREAAIQSAASLEQLRSYRGSEPAKDTPQRVIDRVLAGPPYELNEESDEALSWWLQASRWFASVEPSLPRPADVARLLERRRIRGRLERIGGAGFRGREKDLAKLRTWFAKASPSPMSVTGIGGIGKSALVARFAQELPDDTLLLWLDFDQPDLAPDDAVSILSAIGQQASVQIDGFIAPAVNGDEWKVAAEELGRQLAAHIGSEPAPLLVLDSFEVAQYAERYQELWPVIEAVGSHLPNLRVIVTGRATVPKLTIGGRATEVLALEGMEGEAVRLWLAEWGITSNSIQSQVVDLVQGIPLNVHLAFHLLRGGGDLNEIPRKLPAEIISGYLYDRILNRIQNPELQPVAEASLTLRRLDADMIQPVLEKANVPLPSGSPSSWLAQLAREAALVESGDVLRLRPEVRSASLRLLERHKPELVRTVEKYAEEYYRRRDRDDPYIAAELVYYALRRNDINAAAAAWRDGCGAHLQYEEVSLSDAAAAWLRSRLGVGLVQEAPLNVWEQEAAERIRSLRSRGHTRGVAEVLKERVGRTDDSPLVFEEAYEMRSAGDRAGALKLLDDHGGSSGAVYRDRSLLRALLLSDEGRSLEAEEVLAKASDRELWKEMPEIEWLALFAARIRLTLDFDGEVEAIGWTHDPELIPLYPTISSLDVTLPELQSRVARAFALESVADLQVPQRAEELAAFKAAIDKKRSWSEQISVHAPKQALQLRSRLIQHASRRWHIVTSTTVLAEAFDALPAVRSHYPSSIHALAPLALFATQVWELDPEPEARRAVVSTFLDVWLGERSNTPWTRRQAEILQIGLGVQPFPPAALLQWFLKKNELSKMSIAAVLIAPDPLELLVESRAGVNRTSS